MMSLLLAASGLWAQSQAARQAARELVEWFGRESLERAEPRVARLVEEYGEGAVRALRQAGPAGVPVIEAFGPPAVRILSKWGDRGMRLLAAEGEPACGVLARYGDEAIELMIRHPGVGRDLLGHFGREALRAPLSTESVVVLNRLAEPIKQSGRSREIFDVIERYGDRACDFLWRHKGTIFLTGALVAFLADPKPYLDGVKEIVSQPAGEVAREVAHRTQWTAVFIAAIAILTTAGFLSRYFRLRARAGNVA
jgi:hypothetical protein